MQIYFKVLIYLSLLLSAQVPSWAQSYDILIENGRVFNGEVEFASPTVIGINGDRISYIGKPQKNVEAKHRIDATGLIVAPGFIDVHTHAYNERPEEGAYLMESYITQGVTTVVSGNDGQGPVDIGAAYKSLTNLGIAPNMALYVGHGNLRREYVGLDDRPASGEEMQRMKQAVHTAMRQGALGLSTGLFYTPGSFAGIEEVIELAKVAAEYDGIYDSHIRDESNYSIGLIEAVNEVVTIARVADIHGHIAHIKALGVDVWGVSADVIDLIEDARSEGLKVTADQYPWLASGTSLTASLVPKWARDGGNERMLTRFEDENLLAQIKSEMTENMRRRGGASSLLLTGGAEDWIGKNLQQYADTIGKTPIEAALFAIKRGGARVASFNMNEKDVRAFMQQSWVMTSSDGGNGHPRKYASFPRKYQEYVVRQKILTLLEFINRSTSLPADTLNLKGRGRLVKGAFADIVMFYPDKFKANATFEDAFELSSGVEYLLVNGTPVIEKATITGAVPGRTRLN